MRSSPSPSGFLKTLFINKVFYAILFCLLIPALLVWAAYCLEPYVSLRPIHSLAWGAALSASGLFLATGGMLSLKIKGGGLPMNGFPPPRFVSSGVYRLAPHPIYVGFTLLCAGISCFWGSSAGLYIITPLAGLGCAAIVFGYEKHDLNARFGKNVPETLLSPPPDNGEKASWFDRFRIAILVYGLWAILYSLGSWTGLSADAPSCRLFGEELQPVIQWTGFPYISIYPVAAIFTLSLTTNHALRCFLNTAIFPIALGFAFFLLLPLSGEPLPFTPTEWGGDLLQLDRAWDCHNSIAFPSYHVLWGLIFVGTAWKLGLKKPLFLLLLAWFLLMAWSCVAAGMHGWIDEAGSLVVFILAESRNFLKRKAFESSSWLANSWRQYRVGKLRILNHSLYAFLAAGAGFYLILALAGEHSLLSVLLIMACSLVGSAVWAQLIEGSSQLLRPFGYYGSIIGGVLGVLSVFLLPSSVKTNSSWIVFAAFATAAPWIQAIGRLRCLVQGCCHGRPVEQGNGGQGIRHTNPSSRVCCMTPYTDVPLYPTPVYSLFFNACIGILLIRLWFFHVPAGLLIGLYFILSGLSRFVEEAYRGETQTRQWCKLTEYQWFSIGLVATGFIIWSVPASMMPVSSPVWDHSFWWISLPVGLLYAFCMGMDFPDSHRRFSRLTG